MNTEMLDKLDELNEQERSENEYPWIVFAIGGTEYGINSKYVLSIEILGKLTPMVDAQYYCPGITEFRGEMIDLLDLRTLFGLGDYLSAKEGSQNERVMIIVISVGDVKRGIIVDEVVSVEYITHFIDGVIGDEGSSMDSKYIRQVAKRERHESPILIISPECLGEL